MPDYQKFGLDLLFLLITLDLTARITDKNVSIHLGGPWKKTEAKILTSLPDLPTFLGSEGMEGGKKLGKVVVK